MIYETLHPPIDALGGIPAEAADAYEANAGVMLQHVNRVMTEHGELERLIGGAPLSMMYDNHRNHIMFMASVFRFNAFTLLANTLPWVYRTYHNHGFSHDYFPEVVGVWLDITRKTLGGDSQAILPVYQWMLDNHQRIVALSQLPPVQNFSVAERWKRDYELFLKGLLDGDAPACREIFSPHAAEMSGFLEFCQEVVQPAMYRIGEMWELGQVCVVDEHLASSIVTRLLAAPPVKSNVDRPVPGKAVVTASANEFHEIGIWMVANALEADGWRTLYLGSNSPPESLQNLIKKHRPRVLAISMAVPFNLNHVARGISLARNADPDGRLKVMAGGLAFNLQPELAESLGADGYAPNALMAARLARSWARKAW